MSDRIYVCQYCGTANNFGKVCSRCHVKLPYVKDLVRLGSIIKREVEARKSRRRLIELYNSQKWKE